MYNKCFDFLYRILKRPLWWLLDLNAVFFPRYPRTRVVNVENSLVAVMDKFVNDLFKSSADLR